MLAALVGGSYVSGLFMRLTWLLATMPSADRVPVKSSHSAMLWPEWVVPITGSAGALHAVCPLQPFFQASNGVFWSVIAAGCYLASATGSL